MKKLLTRGLMGLAALAVPAGAALALPMAANAAPATNNSTSASAIFGYQNGNAGTASKTVTVNSNWKIVNETLTVTPAPDFGYGGWTDTFTFTQKTPVGPLAATSLTGTVTLTTPYGTATSSFVASDPTVLPFDVTNPGSLHVDGYGSGNSTSNDIYNTEVQMVYSGLNPGLNAWYWF